MELTNDQDPGSEQLLKDEKSEFGDTRGRQ